MLSPRSFVVFVFAGALLACSQSAPGPAGGTGSGSGGAVGSSGSGGAGGATVMGSGGESGGSGGATVMGSGGAPGGTGGSGGAIDSGSVVDVSQELGMGGDGATPSGGCGATAMPTSGRFMIDVAGTMREYILKVPAGYDPRHPYPLILTFHGAMYSAQTVADGGPPGSGPYYGIESQANGRAIFVAPQALSTSWSNQAGRDVAYVNAMLARFKAELCVDQSRVFSVGFSMGAIMTLTLGCTAGHGFRAIAPMSGSLPGACPGDERTAYWSSHGTNDPTISPAQGAAARDEFRRRNHCGATTTAGMPAGCVEYQGCDAGYPVVWCSFTGVHEPAPYAGDAIWKFFGRF